MDRNLIWREIELSLRKSKKDHPNWPDHAAAQAGKVVEKSGELMKACLQRKYSQENSEVVQDVQNERMKETAIQTAVMAIRFLENLK